MNACPGMSGANGFAATSSLGPAALWMMPEMPLPASNDGLADITIMSGATARMLCWTIVSSLVYVVITHQF